MEQQYLLSVLQSKYHAADALVILGAMASTGMVLTPKPEYFVFSIRKVKEDYNNWWRNDINKAKMMYRKKDS